MFIVHLIHCSRNVVDTQRSVVPTWCTWNCRLFVMWEERCVVQWAQGDIHCNMPTEWQCREMCLLLLLFELSVWNDLEPMSFKLGWCWVEHICRDVSFACLWRSISPGHHDACLVCTFEAWIYAIHVIMWATNAESSIGVWDIMIQTFLVDSYVLPLCLQTWWLHMDSQFMYQKQRQKDLVGSLFLWPPWFTNHMLCMWLVLAAWSSIVVDISA